MKVAVIMDSMKGSISSLDAGKTVARGIHDVDENAEVIVKGFADGGEGTVDVLAKKITTITVHGPYHELTSCRIGISDDTAIIEMAEASGLTKSARRDVQHASTFGVGEAISYALDAGIRRFVIGLGGSATNDGGLGMLMSLGLKAEFKHDHFNILELESIDASRLDPRLKECTFLLASDVTNPLCGENGASAIYGKQKGVQDPKLFDEALRHYADLCIAQGRPDCTNVPGAGAAGGLGYAFLTWFPSRLISGADYVIANTGIEEAIRQSDIVITGEGRMDGQSAMGKGPGKIAEMARKYHKPCIGLAGSLTREADQLGLTAVFSIQLKPQSLEEALQPDVTEEQIRFVSRQIYRLITL